MDGSPSRGETIPIRLFLGGFDLTPTFRDVNKKFSTRYYLSLVLIDEGKLTPPEKRKDGANAAQTPEDTSSNPRSFSTAKHRSPVATTRGRSWPLRPTTAARSCLRPCKRHNRRPYMRDGQNEAGHIVHTLLGRQFFLSFLA